MVAKAGAAKKGAPEDKKPRFGRVKSNLKMGILGLPNVGKSSIFNLLTNQVAAAENYPFCTIEPNKSRCAVPDQRFDWLCDLFKPPSKVPAFLMVTDIAGLIRGASEGAGLGNAFLSHIQAVDGLFHMVRAFDNPEVVHVDDSIDPIRDMETIVHELCMKDIKYVEKQKADGLDQVRKNPTIKLPAVWNEVFDKAIEMLNNGQPLRGGDWNIEQIAKINEVMPECITLKPMVYLVNLDSKSFIRKGNKYLEPIATWVKNHGGGQVIPLSVEWEEGLMELKDNEAARAEYLKDPAGGLLKSVLARCVKVGYNTLALQYYFTAGDKEVACWTVPAGACAPEAAGVIHTDIEKGFIKAEICSFDDFKELCDGKTSMAPIKAAGKYRQEGKTYVMRDGDIVHFMHNQAKKK